MAMLWIAILTFGVKAQSTQLATLQHQEQVSVYYGPEALKKAIAVADNGDVITLSAGQFDAAGINKELTIRGAGMGIESAEGYTIPTIINGSFSINQSATIEGVVCPKYVSISEGISITLTKSKMLNIGLDGNMTVGGIHSSLFTIIQSEVGTDLNYPTWRGVWNGVNSIFVNLCNQGDNFRGNLTNCLCRYTVKKTGLNFVSYTTLTNCIVSLSNNFSKGLEIGSEAAVYNTLVCGRNGDSNFCNEAKGNNVIRRDLDTVFKEEGYYELLDEFKTMTTTDGKEPGIHGGSLGFSQVPNNPQITKFTVAPKTSVDGKLSVEIEVEGLE